MKKIILLTIFGFLLGCGNNDLAPLPSSTEEVPIQEQAEPTELPQPFVFEEVGEFMRAGMLIDLAPLPSGNWLVAARDGNVFLLDPDFLIIDHDFIPTNNYLDNGVMSFVLDNDFETSGLVYFYLTAADTAAPCDTVYCNQIVEYKLDESVSSFLTEKRIVLNIPMLNKFGQHNGGGLVMGPDNLIYATIGDGSPLDDYNPGQDMASPLGKILAIDPSNGDYNIAAVGLRNPFTAAAIPNGFVIGDVGAEVYEEINLYSFGDGLLNFGWPLVEGPGGGFVDPIQGFTHCSAEFVDEDPFGHDGEEEQIKFAVQGKQHNGVVHSCGNRVISALGHYPSIEDNDPYDNELDGSVFYSELYYGWIRAFNIEGGAAVHDRHIAHFRGLTAVAIGPDKHLYGISISVSNKVLKLNPNNEVTE